MNFYLKILLLVIFLSNAKAEMMHSIHISYGEVTISDNCLYGKIIFYKDDFFLALRNWNNVNTKNFTNKQYDQLKLNYLKGHLIATANNNKKLELKITSNNENDKSIWFEIKFDCPEKINEISLKYNVLFNEYSDQMNLLNISTSSGDESLIFNESKPELRIEI